MNGRPSARRSMYLGLHLGLVGTLLFVCAPVLAQPETFVGHLVDTGGAVPGRSSALMRLHVESWSTDDEVRELLQMLSEQGQDALQKALWKVDKGYIRIGDRLGYPISITRSIDTESGRIVRALTDRPMQMFEVMNDLRTTDYPFGIIELQLDSSGRGEGRLLAAASAELREDGTLEIESYGIQPFRILDVRAEKP